MTQTYAEVTHRGVRRITGLPLLIHPQHFLRIYLPPISDERGLLYKHPNQELRHVWKLFPRILLDSVSSLVLGENEIFNWCKRIPISGGYGAGKSKRISMLIKFLFCVSSLQKRAQQSSRIQLSSAGTGALICIYASNQYVNKITLCIPIFQIFVYN